MEAYFTDIEKVICQKIKTADKVYICAAWLTSPAIIDACAEMDAVALLDEDSKLIEGSSSYDSKLVRRLKKSFQKIHIYKNTSRRCLHNKFIILSSDDEPYAVITGSYNFTISANFNYENIVYIEDKALSKQYFDEFCRLVALC